MSREGNNLHCGDSREKGIALPEYRSRRAAAFVGISLAIVLLTHLAGRYGYYKGLYSFVVADTFSLGALIFLGIVTTVLLTRVYEERWISLLSAVGIALIVAGQAVNVIDGIPSFGGAALPLVRSFLAVKEPLSAVGIVLFIGALFWGTYEASRVKLRLQIERGLLEHRVAQRTEELSRTNRRLQSEIAERQQSEDTLRFMIATVEDVFWQMTPDFRFTFISPALLPQSGFTPEEATGRSILDFLTPRSAAALRSQLRTRQNIQPDRERSASATYEFEFVRKDGSVIWCEAVSTPTFDAQGRLYGFQGVTRDITDRVKAQRLIAEQQMTLLNAARLSALGTMASGIAHEINNPMAIISAGAEHLERCLNDPKISAEYKATVTDKIVRNVKRVHHIVKGLRNLSRDGSTDPFVEEPVQAIVAEVLELCQARCTNAGIALTVSLIHESLHVECRAAQLAQVLLNLINNAYDAVKDLPEKWIRLDVRDDGEAIVFAVTDAGRGMPSEIHDQIFLPFFTTKPTGSGIGLGLSISRRMVEDHQGNLRVDPDSPNTRFEVRLPKAHRG